MTLLKIKTAGDAVLKKKARPVAAIDDSIKKLASDMAETMQTAGGLGIAAPQVGVSLRVIVIDFGYLDFEKAESAGETNSPDHAQAIFQESFVWVTYCPDHSFF